MWFYLMVCCLLIGQIDKSLARNVETTETPPVLDEDQLLDLENSLDFNFTISSIKETAQLLNSSIGEKVAAITTEDIKVLRSASDKHNIKLMMNFVEVSKIIDEENFEVAANLIEKLNDAMLVDFSVRTVLDDFPKNPLRAIRLAEILETRVLSQKDVEYPTKQFSQLTFDELKASIRVFTLDALNTSVRKGDFESDEEIENLTAAIYLFDPLQWESIIEEFVNTNYQQVSPKEILKAMTIQRSVEQRARGISVLFGKIEKAGNLNSKVTFNIASALQKLRSDDEFEILSKAQQDEVDNMIERLPVCARNLFFQPTVCFWNKDKEEYITAAAPSSEKYDENRRYIFSADPSPESHWFVNVTGDDDVFLFSSQTYADEYLYAAYYFESEKNLRYVLNFIPGGADEQGQWSIELNGDYCSVKSALFDEFLFASDYKKSGQEDTLVFTWNGPHLVKESNFQWQIRKCD